MALIILKIETDEAQDRHVKTLATNFETSQVEAVLATLRGKATRYQVKELKLK